MYGRPASRGSGRGFAGRRDTNDAGTGRGRGRGYEHHVFRELLTELGCSISPSPLILQRWVVLALQLCDRGDAAQVLQALRKDDGSNLLRSLGQQVSTYQVSVDRALECTPTAGTTCSDTSAAGQEGRDTISRQSKGHACKQATAVF